MLYQMHWQFKNGKTEVWAQIELDPQAESFSKLMGTWEKDVMKKHPLPKGAQWMICNEKSKHFVWAAESKSNQPS